VSARRRSRSAGCTAQRRRGIEPGGSGFTPNVNLVGAADAEPAAWPAPVSERTENLIDSDHLALGDRD